MQVVVQHPILGAIVYEENYWTGKKKIAINGAFLTQSGRNTFLLQNGTETTQVMIKGNFLMGSKLFWNGEAIALVPATKWYEYALCLFAILFNILWGNSVALCSIVPIVGGAIGGGVSGLIAGLGLIFMKSYRSPLAKVAVGIGAFLVSFLVCCGMAFAILSFL